jgi:hypothetical protein
VVTWQTESGSKVFKHEGWTVRVWGPSHEGPRLEFSPPVGSETEVEVTDSYIDFSGRCWNEGGFWGVSIPWKIIEAIVEARREILS